MIERTFVVLLVAMALVAAARLVGSWQTRRLRNARRAPIPPELERFLTPGRPTVLAFSAPGCVECHALQLPAVEQLGARLRERVAIAHFSAPEHPALVSHFGILTVPATVILDATGAARHVNLRYTNADRLLEQVLELSSQ